MIHSLNKIEAQPLENGKNFATIDTMYQYWHFLIHQVVKLGQSQKIRFGLQRTGLVFLPAVMLVLLTVASVVQIQRLKHQQNLTRPHKHLRYPQ